MTGPRPWRTRLQTRPPPLAQPGASRHEFRASDRLPRMRSAAARDGAGQRWNRALPALRRDAVSKPARNSVDRALALTLAAIVLFAVANAFPIVGLSVNGNLVETTLFGAARVLYDDGVWPLAGLVFVTTLLMPLLAHGGGDVSAFAAAHGRISSPARYRVAPAAPGDAVGHDRSADPRDAGRARQARAYRKRCPRRLPCGRSAR